MGTEVHLFCARCLREGQRSGGRGSTCRMYISHGQRGEIGHTRNAKNQGERQFPTALCRGGGRGGLDFAEVYSIFPPRSSGGGKAELVVGMHWVVKLFHRVFNADLNSGREGGERASGQSRGGFQLVSWELFTSPCFFIFFSLCVDPRALDRVLRSRERR